VFVGGDNVGAEKEATPPPREELEDFIARMLGEFADDPTWWRDVSM